VIHPTAATGFDLEAERYDRARPGYPDETVDRVTALAAGPVLDLAAGTGKLTRSLAARGLDVIAAEPVPGMRRRLSRTGAARHVVGAVAEHLPFPAEHFSLVTVAQAFHWFDPIAAWAELTRVVRPGGHVAVLWNARVAKEDWHRRIWATMDGVERTAPWRRNDAPVDAAPGPPWTKVDTTSVEHRVPVTVDLVVDRVASTSHVATLEATEKERVLSEVRAIAEEAPAPLAFVHQANLRVFRR
jgi:SAM-dependent methyltransferase